MEEKTNEKNDKSKNKLKIVGIILASFIFVTVVFTVFAYIIFRIGFNYMTQYTSLENMTLRDIVYDNYLDKAMMACIVDHDYKKALNYYKFVIALDKSDYDGYFRRAQCYMEMKEYENVLKDTQKTLELINNGIETKFNQREAKYYSDDPKLLEMPKSGIKADKKITVILQGEAYYNLNNYDEAIKLFTEAISITKTPVLQQKVYKLRGVCKYRIGDKKGALADYSTSKNLIIKYINKNKNHQKYLQPDLDEVNKLINEAKSK